MSDILYRSTVTSRCRCSHYKEDAPNRALPCTLVTLVAQTIQWCFGKPELAVKIIFCFPRCNTLCHLVLEISALTYQIQLQPYLYSRSSGAAQIKVKNWPVSPSEKPKGRIWLCLLSAYRSNLEKNSLTLVFGCCLWIVWAAADWAKSRVQLFPQFASQINVLLNELLPKSRCLKIRLMALLADRELLNA